MYMDSIIWVFMVLIIALIFVLVFLRFIPVGLWITSLAAGVHVSIASLVGMRLRRIQPKRLVEPLIKARKAGLDVSLAKLETHYLAGGNVDRVINALIAAQRSNIEMPFEHYSEVNFRYSKIYTDGMLGSENTTVWRKKIKEFIIHFSDKYDITYLDRAEECFISTYMKVGR